MGLFFVVVIIPLLFWSAFRLLYLTVRVRWRLQALKLEEFDEVMHFSAGSDLQWYRMFFNETFEKIPDAQIVKWATAARRNLIILCSAVAASIPIITLGLG
jgi:hypothetical protein